MIKLKVLLSILITLSLVGGVLASNSDQKIDRIGKAYGSSKSSDNWDSSADLNGDRIINVFDLVLASKNAKALKGTGKTQYVYNTEGSSTIISVEPNETIIKSPGKNFSIEINITDALETWAWEFKLSWNASVLNITDITEGTFLSQNIYSTAIFNNTHYDEGWTMVGSSLLEPALPSSGNGTLVIINFTTISGGDTVLHLYDTYLLDNDSYNYNHETRDGSVFVGPSYSNSTIYLSASSIYQGESINISCLIRDANTLILYHTILE